MKYDCCVQVFELLESLPALPRKSAPNKTSSDGRGSVTLLVAPLNSWDEHAPILDALALQGSAFRAVACISRCTPHRQIEQMDRRGVRGARIRIDLHDRDAFLSEIDAVDALLPCGWHIELVGSWSCISKLSSSLARKNRTFVGASAHSWPKAIATADLKQVRWWAEMGNFYAKLVIPAHARFAGLSQAVQLAHQLLDTPDRVLWANSWPTLDHYLNRDACGRDMQNMIAAHAGTLLLNARRVYGLEP